ncbi:NADP-dependent oxidoreductase domain-containing protein [Pisolithus orientalis]|uniref:NADP-dependent oxidoreductase domain-containing protein n=1 Tax=Pisolithus orientalis TaxID=936130 RepID=UPI0022244294|nr:NADP-dependent oxidoreductase domain-containing protein [Pisolithus orientalis]KAI5998427.1 NADP-dependent oxidoreductase domain-containing protein [Pisolithus orientalis]
MANSNVEYRQLGKSGLRVSVPIMGCMSFGSEEQWGVRKTLAYYLKKLFLLSPPLQPWILNEDASLEILKAAWDQGINTFDTANVYSNGESERVLGTFIKKYNIPRSQVVLATKVFSLVSEDPGVHTYLIPDLSKQRRYVNQGGLSRTAIFNAVEGCLERLGTSYIDLLQIHRFDPEVPPEETMKALHDIVQSGKARYIGASSMRCWQFALLNEVAEKHGWTKFVSMQDEHSLLYREGEREMHAYCKYHGIGLIPWSPLAAGALARLPGARTTRSKALEQTPFKMVYSDADTAIVNRVNELAQKKGWKMSQVALAWSQAKVTSPIVGANSVSRVQESVIREFTLTPEEISYLEEPYVAKAVRV